MTLCHYLRTTDLAQAGQISVQQVRNYEASEFLPPAERSPAGYRRYTQKHRVALKTARNLAGSYGWQRARTMMQAVHRGNLSVALALIDECHAELARNLAGSYGWQRARTMCRQFIGATFPSRSR